MSWSRGQRSLTRIDELSTVCHLMAERSGELRATKLAEEADRFLQTARQAAGPRRPFWGRFGASIDTIETNIHAAVCLMLRYMPVQHLRGWLPELSALIQAHLPAQDPRRTAVEEILRDIHDEKKDKPPILDESKREAIISATHAALEAQEEEYVRVRSFRNTSVPYSIPMALALLKLPTGALTAVLGLLLMRGEFIPGLSALDTSAQIIAWAVVFGYAQQLFTRPVDERGQAILNSVGGAEHGTLMDQRMIPPSGAST